MKISIIFSAIFIFSFCSTQIIAQNIGIGVSNPLQKLHVGGNIRIDGIATSGTGVITTNANGDLLRTNFSGNANEVLKGNGTFGTVPGGLPSGAIVGSPSPNDAALLAAGFSFYSELSSPTKAFHTFPATVSNQYTQAPTYEYGSPAKTPPPSGREGAIGLWTGTEALIWGGYSFFGFSVNMFNDGSKYNPSTDTWTPISTVNAPGRRAYPSAVWTGSEMLIWGGIDSMYTQIDGSVVPTITNDGGRYNPSTNTWTSMNTTGAPSPRAQLTGVWTGSYMVVWGGTGLISIFENGGRYNPASNSWTSIPTGTPGPGADGSTRLFWTGTHVLVLGNEDSIGRYQPNTNTWVASAKFPGGFYDKTAAIWTGSELWVYINFSNQIYKYNPTTNIWSGPTAIVGGGPDPNFIIRTAVWSDAELILYGFIRDANNKITQNRYYRYNPGLNSFISSGNEIIIHNQLVDFGVLFFKAGSMIIKWGGSFNFSDPVIGNGNYFSNQGTRIYLSSGVAIPTIYISTVSSKPLYLYQRN